jgi:hypothetical protein
MWQDGEEAAGGGRGVKGPRIVRSASAAGGGCSAIGRRAPDGFLPQRRIVALCTLHITTVASSLLLQRVARLHHVCYCSTLHVASCLLLQRDRSEGTVRPLAADPSLPDVLLRLSRILPRHAKPCSEPPTRTRAIPRPHQPPSRRRPPRLGAVMLQSKAECCLVPRAEAVPARISTHSTGLRCPRR